MILVREIYVELDDAVKAVASQIAGGLVVLRRGGSGKGRGRPESGERTVSMQEIGGNRVMRDAVVIEDRVGSGLVCGGWLCGVIQSTDQKALMLAAEEEEEFVFDNRSANGEAIVLISRCGLGC